MKDFEEIKRHYMSLQSQFRARKEGSRALTDISAEKRPFHEDITTALQAQTTDHGDRTKMRPSLNSDPAGNLHPWQSHKPLGPSVSDWDNTRRLHRKVRNGDDTPKMILVTGSQPSACENPVGDHVLLMYAKNKMDYCRIHGIDMFYNMAHLDSEMSGFWAKLPILRKLMLAHPDVEWLWWMDSDAVITDMAFKLPMAKYSEYNMVLHGWDHMVYEKRNWIGLNTGSFLIRNSQWSMDLLDAWAPMGPKGPARNEAGKFLAEELTGGRPPFEADDQSALIYLLATEKDKWADKVYLESSYYLHGYWKLVVDKYEEMMEKNHNGLGDERWPFVTHFVGCKPCKKPDTEDDDAEKCFKQMERAFNFADNQVLQLYGFRHSSLSERAVFVIPEKTHVADKKERTGHVHFLPHPSENSTM
ncbi:hypothetical protein KP509_35G047000 [Ceratopteris richardii]|nr:hypothetical protein KP509_35G047000 [Ceratopteris richardii]